MKNILYIFVIFPLLVYSQIPSNGLLRSYEFNNDFSESSGGDVAISTNSSFIADHNGTLNSAINLDGTASVSLGDSSDLQVSAFSYSFWINPTTWNNQDIIIDKKNSHQIRGKNGFIELFIASPSRIAKISNANFPINTWTHLIVTFNNGNVQFFVNGINISNQMVASSAPISNGLPLLLGKSAYTNFFLFNGALDEFLLYNRAVTPTEASQIYNAYFVGCADGIQNGSETGIDCGGPDCDPCSTCTDGIQNGSETDIDCGGPDCNECITNDSTTIVVESLWDTIGNTITPKDIELNVGIGTTNAIRKLSVIGDVGIEGNIKAIDFTATPNVWADYVFLDDYKLPTLEEIEAFIEINKHLPNMPSEKDVLDNGINLGQTDAKLLEKIEELTLHLIEMNKRIKELEKKQD